MNDDAFLPEASPEDALVSAHLDGEATPEEIARVQADAVLRDRAAVLIEVQDWVGEPVAVPAASRESAIEAALRLYDEQQDAEQQDAEQAAVGPPSSPAAGDDLAAARERREARSSNTKRGRGPQWLAVAAAVVVVLAGVGVALRATTRSADDTATVAVGQSANSYSTSDRPLSAAGSAGEQGKSTPENADASTGSGAQSPSASTTVAGATGATPTTTASTTDRTAQAGELGYAGNLGTLASPADVRAAVNASIAQASGGQPAPTTAPPPSPDGGGGLSFAQAIAAVESCSTKIRATDPEVDEVIYSATARYQGQDAVILVYRIDRDAHPAANGPARIYTVTASDCRVLDVQTV